MDRNKQIDLIKGLCIVFVIITHFSWTETERLKMLFPFWIDMAVPIFMAISGYVYTKSFLKNNIASIEKAYYPFDIIKRILRFTVPYGIFFAVEVMLDMLYPPRESIFNIIARFFRGGYGPGGYYYPIMIQFIFVFPVIFVLVKRNNHFGVFICGLINVLYEFMKIIYFLDEECYRFLIFRYIFIIAYGCYLGVQKPKHKWKWEMGACLIGFIYLLMYVYIGISPKIFIYWTGTSCIAALFVLPLVRYVVTKMRTRCVVLEMVGRASFNIYLVQMVYYGFEEMLGYRTKNRILNIGLIVLSCLVIGELFWRVTQRLGERTLELMKGNGRH